MTESFIFDDFSGGLDLVSDYHRTPQNATPFAVNFRTNSSGGVEVMPGYNTSYGLATNSNARDLFWFEKSDNSTERLIIATKGTGSNGKWIAWTPSTSGLGAGTYTDIRTTLTAVDHTTFVAFEDKLYGLDPLNNIGKWDGSTLDVAAPGTASGPNKGIILGIWQNRMWTAPATAGAIGMRVEWSDPANVTHGFSDSGGTATDLWPADNYIILGATSGAAERIVGGMPTQDGLLVFSNRAVYLIHDDATGAYVTVDPSYGCVGRRSIKRDDQGRIFFMSRNGIRRIDGQRASVSAAPQVDPHFALQGISLAMEPCGAIFDGSYWVAFAPNDSNAGSLTYNRALFEVNLSTGSAMWHTTMSQARCFVSRPSSSGYRPALYYISAATATDGTALYEGMTGSNAIETALYMLPFHPSQDPLRYKQMQRIFVRGDGSYTCNVYPTIDYNSLYGTSGTPFGAFAITYPAGQATSIMERGRTVISGVNGIALSALVAYTSPTVSTGVPGNPIPIGVTNKVRGPVLSQVSIEYSPTSRAIP